MQLPLLIIIPQRNRKLSAEHKYSKSLLGSPKIIALLLVFRLLTVNIVQQYA